MARSASRRSKDGGSETDGAVAHDGLDGAADGVAVFAGGFDEVDHLVHDGGVTGAHDVRFDDFGGDGVGIDLGLDVFDGGNPSEGFETGGEHFENFFGDCGGGDATDGFARGGAAASVGIATAEFGIVGVVGMGGTVFDRHLVVGPGALVLVADVNRNGGADGVALVDAGEDFAGVGLVARGHDLGLAGTAAVEFVLDDFLGNGDAGRAAIDNDADASAMRFAEGRDFEQGAESIAHGRSLTSAQGLKSPFRLLSASKDFTASKEVG